MADSFLILVPLLVLAVVLLLGFAGCGFLAARRGVNVYELKLPTPPSTAAPKAGSWSGRCEMTVGADGKTAVGDSGAITFVLPVTPEDAAARHHELSFVATGSPLGPQSQVTGGFVEG